MSLSSDNYSKNSTSTALVVSTNLFFSQAQQQKLHDLRIQKETLERLQRTNNQVLRKLEHEKRLSDDLTKLLKYLLENRDKKNTLRKLSSLLEGCSKQEKEVLRAALLEKFRYNPDDYIYNLLILFAENSPVNMVCPVTGRNPGYIKNDKIVFFTGHIYANAPGVMEYHQNLYGAIHPEDMKKVEIAKKNPPSKYVRIDRDGKEYSHRDKLGLVGVMTLIGLLAGVGLFASAGLFLAAITGLPGVLIGAIATIGLGLAVGFIVGSIYALKGLYESRVVLLSEVSAIHKNNRAPDSPSQQPQLKHTDVQTAQKMQKSSTAVPVVAATVAPPVILTSSSRLYPTLRPSAPELSPPLENNGQKLRF